MSLKKSAAFSLILVVLAIGLKVPSPSTLLVDGFGSASLLTARGGGRAADIAPSQPLRYINPIYSDPDDRFSKDPAVIEHEGRYYVYYFGYTFRGREAIKVASSQDLVRWRYEGVAIEAGKDGSWDADLIWAPDVVFRNGLFYMYYSGGRLKPNGAIDWSTMRIGLAVSREPAGRFVRSSRNPVLTPPFGNGVIDPDFFADDDGRDYLYYVVQTSSQGHWEGIRVQRVDGMERFHDDAEVIGPTAAWEADIVEAPTVFKANGHYYLLYSGGRSENGQNIGYAISRVPTISGRSGVSNWTKYPNDTMPQPLIGHGEKWADLAVGSASLLDLSREMYVIFQGKNGLDGKFRLGMARLSLSDPHWPMQLVR